MPDCVPQTDTAGHSVYCAVHMRCVLRRAVKKLAGHLGVLQRLIYQHIRDTERLEKF